MRKKMIETLLQHGLIINPKDVDNPGLLSTAVEKGDLKIVEDLLKYREDINMLIDDYSTGHTPLHSAVKGKQVQMAKLLINYGANVNVKDSEGTAPIVCAIQNNDIEMTDLLLTNVANIKGDHMVLRAGVQRGRENLLNGGASEDMLNSIKVKTQTLLHIAVEGKQVQLAKLLINYGANVNVKDGRGAIPIVYAIENNDTEMIKLLLTNGSDIKKDVKVLCTAVEKGSLKIVEDLLKYGADVNMLDNTYFRGLTPLHVAVKEKQVQIAKLLINYGANVNSIGWGSTPIHYAIQNNDAEMTELLVTNGVDIKKDPEVLCTAVKEGSLKIVEDLLKYGADVNARNQYGKTPLHYTVLDITMDNECKSKLQACFNWYRDTRYRTLHDRHCMQKIVELLLSKGANVNVKTKNGVTALFAACRKGYKDIVKVLLKHGAECDPEAEEDTKPLHAAAVGGHSKIVEDLLKFGAKVDSRDRYGKTALHFAFRGRRKKVIRTLLEYGSDVNIISIKNHTPLEYGMLVEDYIRNIMDDYLYFEHNTNDSPSTKLLKQHIAKMKAAGLHISERNLLGISNDHEINNFLNKCEAEIEIMKSEKIDNSCASFYDILTKNASQLAKNKSIIQAFRSNDYKTKFPIYSSMIDSRFRRGVKREKLLVQVRKKFLHSLFRRLPELPLLCADKIFSYLSDKDLKMLLVL